MEECFKFSDGLKAGWELSLYFHGRTTTSEVVVSNLRLDGASSCSGATDKLSVYSVRSPVPWREIGLSAILGSVERFEEGSTKDRIVREVRTDRFVVFERRDGVLIRPEVPLVHMITRFVQFE